MSTTTLRCSSAHSALARTRRSPTPGYRRVTTFLNRESLPRNHKRVYRVMKAAVLPATGFP